MESYDLIMFMDWFPVANGDACTIKSIKLSNNLITNIHIKTSIWFSFFRVEKILLGLKSNQINLLLYILDNTTEYKCRLFEVDYCINSQNTWHNNAL